MTPQALIAMALVGLLALVMGYAMSVAWLIMSGTILFMLALLVDLAGRRRDL